jgi:hypothetical protein
MTKRLLVTIGSIRLRTRRTSMADDRAIQFVCAMTSCRRRRGVRSGHAVLHCLAGAAWTGYHAPAFRAAAAAANARRASCVFASHPGKDNNNGP